MITADLKFLDCNAAATVPATILGHNLELFDRASADLCSDRLQNPKFAGPANPATGVARGWQTPSSNFMGIHYELVAGEGIMGSEAQLLQSTSHRGGKGLIQPGRWVRRGERLAVSFWARAIHAPVTLRLGVRPAAIWSADYASVSLHIASGCWHEYTAQISMPQDDDAAVFFCWLEEPGLVALDQVHLRPAGAGVIRRDILDTLGAFGMPLLRFPGGCITTAYHWQFGTGPHYRRPVLPDPVFKREMSYEFGTDEFLAFCQEFNIAPVLTVNVGTGTPDEAADWAAYCAAWYRSRGLPPPTLYWQLGNEQYGHWERSHMTPTMYAQAVRELAPGIRAAYPNSRLAALGMASGDLLDQGKQPWRQPLLEAAGDVFDIVALQLYATLQKQDNAAEQHLKAMAAADGNARQLREAAADCRARGLATRVALSEWNLWIHASHFAPEGFVEPMDAQHALFASAMFHHFVRLVPDFEFAAMYQIISAMGTFDIRGPEVRRTLMADTFSFYRPALPGTRLDLSLNSPELGNGVSLLDAAATANAQGRWLYLTNRSLEQGATVALPATALEAVTMAAGSVADLAMPQLPARVRAATVELPPLSITRLRLPAETHT